jgi:hypothetical protein
MNARTLVLGLILALALVGCQKQQESETPPSAEAAPALEAAQPRGPVTLRLRWPLGARYLEHMEIVQSVETTAGGSAQAVKQVVELGQDFELFVQAERPDGGRDVQMGCVALQMALRAGDRVLSSFDSARESGEGNTNFVAEMFRTLARTPIKVVLDVSNHVARLEGFEDLRNKALVNSPAASRADMNHMLSEDSLKRNFNFGQGLPDHPVRIGDSWPVQSEINLGPLGTMELHQQYVMRGFGVRENRPCAILEFNGVLKRKLGGDAASPYLKTSIENGTANGRNWFDLELGMVVAAEVNQSVKINVEIVSQNPAVTNGPHTSRTMTNQINQTIKFTIKPAAPTKQRR